MGHGLKGITERIELLQGTAEFTVENKSLVISMSIPYLLKNAGL